VILILRKKGYTKKGREARKDKYYRVCFRCARELAKAGFYEFGTYWRSILLTHGVGVY